VTDTPHLSDDTREALARRLKRIEGQVRGIQKMIDENRYCPDVLVQIASVQEALRGVGRVLLQNHLTSCTAEAFRRDDPEEVTRVVTELIDLWGRRS
jgi:DNA-binding FrmR family transcriptional regulator